MDSEKIDGLFGGLKALGVTKLSVEFTQPSSLSVQLAQPSPPTLREHEVSQTPLASECRRELDNALAEIRRLKDYNSQLANEIAKLNREKTESSEVNAKLREALSAALPSEPEKKPESAKEEVKEPEAAKKAEKKSHKKPPEKKNLYEDFCDLVAKDDGGEGRREERTEMIRRMGLDDLLRLNNEFQLGLDTDKPEKEIREDAVEAF